MVDALDLESSTRKGVEVQVLSPGKVWPNPGKAKQ